MNKRIKRRHKVKFIRVLLRNANSVNYVLLDQLQNINKKYFPRFSEADYFNLASALDNENIIELTSTGDNLVYRIQLLTEGYMFFDKRFWMRVSVVVSFFLGVLSGVGIPWLSSILC